jgi:hypothetical protein
LKSSNLLYEKGGWQVCPKQHLLKIGIPESKLSADGFYKMGDTILAFMPKNLYQLKEVEKDKRANEPMKQIRKMLKDGDPSVGGKDTHETMKGLQTGTQLGMK